MGWIFTNILEANQITYTVSTRSQSCIRGTIILCNHFMSAMIWSSSSKLAEAQWLQKLKNGNIVVSKKEKLLSTQRNREVDSQCMHKVNIIMIRVWGEIDCFCTLSLKWEVIVLRQRKRMRGLFQAAVNIRSLYVYGAIIVE